MLVFIALLVIAFVISVVVFLVEAVPIFKASKKLNRPCAWLIWLGWLPVVGTYIKTYVLCDIAGDKSVKLFGKYEIESRLTSFWIYVGISVLGTAIISIIVSILSFIPIIGAFSWILSYIPVVVLAVFNYAYLRDVLDLFKADKNANNTAAIIVTILDSTVTFGLARAIYLYTIYKLDPLPQDYESYNNY